MKNKLLIICGPTATGKTSLAIKLAGKLNGEIISADSRQVYKYMDIGTGKDIPDDAKIVKKGKYLFYKLNGVCLWGYDLVDPVDDFSVSQYTVFARDVISDISDRGKLPIIAGGTGLYIKSIVDGIDTINIPRNTGLRKGYQAKNKEELFETLAKMDPIKAASMNLSDKKNPRRLIRAIEVAIYKIENLTKTVKADTPHPDTLFLGLACSHEELSLRIDARVDKRMDEGFIFEVESLLKHGVTWKNQSMQSLGYKESEKFLKKGLSYEDFISLWCTNEKRYAKRQMTWFKKDRRILWFDIKKDDYVKQVEKAVAEWDNMGNGEKS